MSEDSELLAEMLSVLNCRKRCGLWHTKGCNLKTARHSNRAFNYLSNVSGSFLCNNYFNYYYYFLNLRSREVQFANRG